MTIKFLDLLPRSKNTGTDALMSEFPLGVVPPRWILSLSWWSIPTTARGVGVVNIHRSLVAVKFLRSPRRTGEFKRKDLRLVSSYAYQQKAYYRVAKLLVLDIGRKPWNDAAFSVCPSDYFAPIVSTHCSLRSPPPGYAFRNAVLSMWLMYIQRNQQCDFIRTIRTIDAVHKFYSYSARFFYVSLWLCWASKRINSTSYIIFTYSRTHSAQSQIL